MCTASKVVNGEYGEALGKLQSQTSSSRVSKTKYSLGGVDDDNVANDLYSEAYAGPHDGFTKHDQKDMYRMGKIQELRVR